MHIAYNIYLIYNISLCMARLGKKVAPTFLGCMDGTSRLVEREIAVGPFA
jgi:hypothetical protein